jgi:nitrile hydratase
MVDGVHDMGGMDGLGPLEVEENEPWFHAEWERRAFALTLAAGASGKWNLDKSRYERELMPGPDYLTTSYYEHWLYGLAQLLLEYGFVNEVELASGKPDPKQPKVVDARYLEGANVEKVLRKGGSVLREADLTPAFSEGEMVRVINRHPSSHTRAPRYTRGRQGMIDRVHGIMVFPDSNAMGDGEQPHYCYSVRFSAAELWGQDADEKNFVYVDLWENYLENL